VDIGGQDSKGIRVENGKVVDFVMNDKCAAGTGRFLEIIAEALGISLDKLGELSLAAEKPAVIGNTCTVFAEQEVISQLAGGELCPTQRAFIRPSRLHFALVSKLKIKPEAAITGGGAKTSGWLKR
jgi:predicted CoA-substrate-specific enzyme activase